MAAQLSSDDVTRRWSGWLESTGRTWGTEREVTVVDRSETNRGEEPARIFVHEVFVRADLVERRSLDLLLVALLQSTDQADSAQLVVVGPDDLRARAHSEESAGGLTIDEIPLSSTPAGLRADMALLRIDRTSRAREVAASVASLGRLLDYRHDVTASDAVAVAVLRRLEVLTSGPGVLVSLAGAVGRAAEPRGDGMYLLSATPLGLEAEVELRQGRLTVAVATMQSSRTIATPESVVGPRATQPSARMSSHRDIQRAPWQGGDYALVRVGQASAPRVDAAESLVRRRTEYALELEALGTTATQTAESSYSARAAAARQEARARQILAHVADHETEAAVELLAFGLAQPGALGALVDGVTAGVGSVADFWERRTVAQRVMADLAVGSEAQEIADAIRSRLGEQLDDLLHLKTQVGDWADLLPVVRPIVLELSDDLVPIIDSRQDGERFFSELIPDMRERVARATGVSIPAVRARGNPNLGTGKFIVQVDEIPRIEAVAEPGGYYTARPVDGDGGSREVAETHPVTGEPGRWLIEHHIGEPPADVLDDAGSGTPFTPAEYLAHRIERVARAHLRRHLGREEVQTQLDGWRTEDPVSVARALDGPVAGDRLMVLLQDLVAERVPISDWRTVLAAVETAGGIGTSLRVLHRAVRKRLRDVLPGPRSDAIFEVPTHLQVGLSSRAGADPAFETHDGDDGARARVELLGWVRRMVSQHGSVISLVARDAETREALAALVSTEHAVVTTFSADEVTVE